MKTSTRLSLIHFLRGMIVQIVAMLMLLALVVLVQSKGFTPSLPVNALLVVALMPALVVIHESAHAIVGKVVGLDVKRVQIGIGATVRRGTLLGVDVHIGSFPFSGFCFMIPTKATGARWRYWLSIAAGPITSLAMVLIALWLAKDDGWLRLIDYDEVTPIGCFFFANAFMLSATMVPWGGGASGSMIASDGKRLLQIPFMRDIDTHLRVSHFAFEAAFALERQDVDGALSWVEKGLSHLPNNVVLRGLQSGILMQQGHMRAAYDILMELRDQPEIPAPARDVYANDAAWASLFLDEPDLHEEALRAARRVALVRDKEPWAHGTYGSALVRCGKPSAALPELKKAFRSHTRDTGRAHNAAWIALAEAMRGHPERASKWLATARELDPTCNSIPFVEHEIGELQASG